MKTGLVGKTRLFFYILSHPWEAVRAITDLVEERGTLDAELVTLKKALADEKLKNAGVRVSQQS